MGIHFCQSIQIYVTYVYEKSIHIPNTYVCHCNHTYVLILKLSYLYSFPRVLVYEGAHLPIVRQSYGTNQRAFTSHMMFMAWSFLSLFEVNLVGKAVDINRVKYDTLLGFSQTIPQPGRF